MGKASPCEISLSGPAELWNRVSVEILFAEIAGESVFVQVPIGEIAEPQLDRGGVAGKLKALPYIWIQGGHFYKTSDSCEEGRFVPLTVNEYSNGQREKSEEELRRTLTLLSDHVPGIRIFNQPKKPTVSND